MYWASRYTHMYMHKLHVHCVCCTVYYPYLLLAILVLEFLSLHILYPPQLLLEWNNMQHVH